MNREYDPDATTGMSDRSVKKLRWAWWIALGIIAVMATAAYLLLQQMLAAYRTDEDLILLANAANAAPPPERAPLLLSLRSATDEFDLNQDRLLRIVGADPASSLATHPGSIESIFYSAPYHLDYFSINLTANSRRFIAAFEQEAAAGGQTRYLAGRERARLDAAVADATLAGYAELERRIALRSANKLDTMLRAHSILFAVTLLVLALVGAMIFRPMTAMIGRRTAELLVARNSMAHLANHDGLTGLYNRAFLLDRFDSILGETDASGGRAAVFQFDLDRFKQINDTLGHAAGDHVLMEIARRMVQTAGQQNVCVRLGGDEFVMVLRDIGDTSALAETAGRVLERVNEPITYQGGLIHAGASLGIAVYPCDAATSRDLLVHADLALYSAKKLGGGSHVFFSDELRAELEHHKRLERDIKEAILCGGFVPYFQPQVSLSRGVVTGIESLIRWTHRNRGTIPPGEFLPVAEKSGLMKQIGRVLFRKAIEEAAAWHRDGIEFGRLAINVSGAELREADFVDFLLGTLERNRLPASKLSLEIVESVILDDEKTGLAEKLRKIRAAGVHLELDDFGTGYASLSHVDPSEIDRVKIDRRFVHDIDANSDQAKIVKAIVDLAQGLGIAIVAEGAETQAELDLLASIGCDEVQGYAIAHPMPGSAARSWLAARVRPASGTAAA